MDKQDLVASDLLVKILSGRLVELVEAIRVHRDGCAEECTTTEDQMLWGKIDGLVPMRTGDR